MPPTYLETLARKLDGLKKPNHKFVMVSSGIVSKITQELLRQYPINQRTEISRKLFHEWSQMNQTLQGLRAIIKDNVLIYPTGTVEGILAAMRKEVNYGDVAAIVPDETKEDLQSKVTGLKIISWSECLIFD